MPYEIYTKTGSDSTSSLPIIDPYMKFVGTFWSSAPYTFNKGSKYMLVVLQTSSSAYIDILKNDGSTHSIQLQPGITLIEMFTWTGNITINGSVTHIVGTDSFRNMTLAYKQAWVGAHYNIRIYELPT